MDDLNLKTAFGRTPAHVQECILRSLKREERMRKKMKRKWTAALPAAGLMILLMATAAVAANHFGIMELFSTGDKRNEMIPEVTQQLSQRFEGDTVCMTMQEAVFDGEGGAFAMTWMFENLTDEENLYVVCDELTFGGEGVHLRSYNRVTEFFLEKGSAYSSAIGELPENGSEECRMVFTVLRPLSAIEKITRENTAQAILKKGNIPLDGMGYIEVPVQGDSYSQSLIDSGLFEMADRIEIEFELDKTSAEGIGRTYQGKKNFVFDDYEINIRRAEITATAVHAEIEYITNEKPADGGKPMGPLWGVRFETAEGDFWYGNGGGAFYDPVQLEDGRYSNVYEFEALELFTQPDVLYVTLVRYDDDFKETAMTEDTIELRFE